MKKISFIVALSFLAASCNVKSYNCVCSTNGSQPTVVGTYNASSKKKANEKCDALSNGQTKCTAE